MTSKYQMKKQTSIKTAVQLAVPVAGKAVKGPPNRKMAKRLAQRIYAWTFPEYSKSNFAKAKEEGGAKRPGSYAK
jgi:hypothetical protein